MGDLAAPVIAGPALDFLDEYEQIVQPDTRRYPRVRVGPRLPISPLVRLLVWWRDNGTCAVCKRPTHYSDQPTRSAPLADQRLNLDHILPWSAGGPDDAANLRVTCQACNSARSNYRAVGDGRQRRPVTPCCDRCLDIHRGVVEDDEEDGDVLSEWLRHHDLIANRRRSWSRRDRGGCPVCADVPAGPFEEAVAYCGMCSALSLVTDAGRLL